jgi:DNA ligase-1
MNFKQPMLAGKCEDIHSLRYPLLASAKLDGVRAVVLGGRLLSRQLKPIPNAWVQKMFSGLPEGTDGELIFGDPTHPDAYRNTVSAVMSEDGEPTQVCFHVFDTFAKDGGFSTRFTYLKEFVDGTKPANVFAVPHSVLHNPEELELVEQIALVEGYEGIMVRSIEGPYKQGRSTEKEGYLLKIKRFQDAEAVVLSTVEWESNTNTATTSLTGHTERSSHKSGMVGMGVLGALEVRGLGGVYDGVEFSVGSGFDGADDPNGERGKLWAVRDSLVGKIVKFKFFPSGSKDKPRFPTFLGWRDPIDL